MRQYLFSLLAGLAVLAGACTDASKDPIRINDLIRGNMLALRGMAYANLTDTSFRGAVDKFKLATVDPAVETFDFETAYLSDQPESLDQVQVYAALTETGERKLVATVPASQFAIPSDGDDPEAAIQVPLRTILDVLGIKLTDLTANSYLFVQLDAVLADGTIVESSDVVNNGLYQSATFYPAHSMRYLILQ